MEERKGVSPPTNIGIPLLLVVFLILCLFTFSAIALVQANNENQNSQSTAESRSRYYAAVNSAELSLQKKNQDLLKNGTKGAEKTIRESFTINKDSTLQVVYTLVTTGPNPYYTMTQAKSVTTSEWEGDDKLNIIH